MQLRPRRRLWLDYAIEQALEVSLKRGDRGAQLVRHIANQLAAASLGCLECAGHIVECRGQVAQFVIPASGHALRVVSVSESSARGHQPSYGVDDATGHKNAGRDGG